MPRGCAAREHEQPVVLVHVRGEDHRLRRLHERLAAAHELDPAGAPVAVREDAGHARAGEDLEVPPLLGERDGRDVADALALTWQPLDVQKPW